MVKFICYLILFLSFTSCQNTNNEPNTPKTLSEVPSRSDEPKSLVFQVKKIAQKEGNCEEENSICITIEVDLPIANEGRVGVAQTINTTIQTFLVKTLDFGEAEASKNINIDTAIANIIKEFGIARKENPEGYPFWKFTIGASITYQDEKLVSIRFDTYANTGGAHPNGWMDFLNFDTQTGKLLDNSDLIKDKKGLTILAEKKFRAYHKLEPNINLADAGFEFQYLHTKGTEEPKEEDIGVFALPKVIGIDKDKLILCYNSYDIAAYVVGPTILEIPLSEVNTFLNIE